MTNAEVEPTFDENGDPSDPNAEVVPGLFQADTTYSPIQLFYLGFDTVVDLCGLDRGDGLLDETYIVHPIDDVPWIDDPARIEALAQQVAELVRSDQRVVVNCMSGLNRSGLLVGRTLIELGFSSRDAIELIRRARGQHALSNKEFARWLLIDCSPRGLTRRRDEQAHARATDQASVAQVRYVIDNDGITA
jgi:hypothetical protein